MAENSIISVPSGSGSTVTDNEGNTGTRKRRVKETKREIERKRRCSGPAGVSPFKLCRHGNSTYQCKTITEEDVQKLLKCVYNNTSKAFQDQWISRYIAVDNIRRSRPRFEEGKKKPHSLAITYFIPNKENKNVQVCQSFFVNATKFSKYRLIRIAKLLKDGQFPLEKRGGDRISHRSVVKKESVREFIRKLRRIESHYGRGKSVRIYLTSDLNICQLHKIYNKDNENMRVSFRMFQRIFTTEFNIGFRSPSSDVCAYCTRLEHQIQCEKDTQKKRNLLNEKRVHKMRANAFYDLAKENPPNSITLCFDMEQVQLLPRTPIQDAFYYHQISYYTLCIVGMDSRSPVFYSWSEELAGRGATEVASALINHLSNLTLENISSVRLFCDGCSGQNKNSFVLHALLFWLWNKSPESVQSIIIHFPVRGHSFLPADRVFGRIDKLLRKTPTIVHKEEYYEIYRKLGSVKVLGIDWKLLDIKSLENVYKMLNGISNFKRVLLMKKITKSGVIGEVVGAEDFKFSNLLEKNRESLLKRGKSSKRELLELPLGREIKKKTIEKLLKAQFGENWREDGNLQFYKAILDREETRDRTEGEEPEEVCNCCEEECALCI